MLIAAVAFFRVALVMLCLETAWRYGRWWHEVYRDPETKLMRDLMLGICIAQCGLLLFAVYALVVGRVPRGTLALTVWFIGDSLIVVGTMMHLTSAWRISLRWRNRLTFNIIIRALLATVIAAVLLLLDRQ